MSKRSMPEAPQRKAWPADVKRAVKERSGGKCEYPDCTEPGAELDHTVPVAIGGQSTLHNCVLLCRNHHVQKTRLDIRLIAKGRRIRAKHFSVPAEDAAKNGPKNGRLKSRGFDKSLRKKMNGQVVRVSKSPVLDEAGGE